MLKMFSTAAAFAVFATCGAEAATVPAVDANYDAYTVNNAWAGTQGYRFRVNQDVDVTALGAWDYLGNGFEKTRGGMDGSAQIGLFTTSGTLLGSTSIAGAAGRLIGQFRYADLTSAIHLLAGMEYVLGSWSNDYNAAFNANYGNVTMAVDPRITLLRNRDTVPGATGSLMFPSREPMNNHLGSFGPTMLIDDVQVAPVPVPVPVPVPAAGLMLMTAAGAFGLTRRRKRG